MREKAAGIGIVLLNVIIFSVLLFTQKYSPFLVILNLISVIVIWIWLLNPKTAFKFIKENKVDFYCIIILFILSLIVLSYKIDTVRPGIYGDELAAGINGIALLKTGELPPFVDTYVHPLVHSYLIAWSAAIFGNTIFAVRFPIILAGALSAAGLYVLLRQFFKKKIALITSLIFVLSYQHFIIWRQSYETGESVLFQIVALIFLYLVFKKKDLRNLIGFGLAIGASLHFYISIRTIAFSMVILSIYFLRTFPFRKLMQYLAILFVSIFISTAVLSSYAVVNWGSFWQRAHDLSVFGRNLPAKDVIGEILGSVRNDAGLFIFSGDPNPRYNPSGLPLYDFLSSILIVSGFALLFLKKRKLFYLLIFLFLPVIVNEIFAIEVFPEFHYYGTGHPNSLRISGFIPLFYLLIGFALVNLESLLQKVSKQLSNIALFSVCVIAAVINLYSYFGQQSVNPMFFVYNYRYGDAFSQDTFNFINEKNMSEVYVQKAFINSRADFFLKKSTSLKAIDEKNIPEVLNLIANSKIVIINAFIDTIENTDFVNKLMEKVQERKIPYGRLSTPFGPYGAIIFNSN